MVSWTDPATGQSYTALWDADAPSGEVHLVAGVGLEQQEMWLPFEAILKIVEGYQLLAEQGVFDAPP